MKKVKKAFNALLILASFLSLIYLCHPRTYVVVVDNCQYVYYDGAITHKADCKNHNKGQKL